MYRIGGRRLVVVGVPPMGCIPLVRTIMGEAKCVDTYNRVAFSFNSKIQKELIAVRSTIGMKTAFVDAFTIIQNAVNNPQKYGQFLPPSFFPSICSAFFLVKFNLLCFIS